MSMESLPPIQTGPSAWYGPDMAHRQDLWLIELSNPQIEELLIAAEPIADSDFNIGWLTQSEFALPSLGPQLAELRKELITDRGFAVLRGLPVNDFSERLAATIFFGLGTHLGLARSQNADGHVLGHVCNLGASSADPSVRIYQTRERQTFHTDSCDVVGLLCLQPARKGGRSLLVSANTIFNEMRTRRPDLLKILMQPIATDRRGEVPLGMLPYLLIPVFNWHEKQITPFYQRQYIESAQRFEDAPRLTPDHIEALDLLDQLANDPELHLSMMLEAGDMQFVYNHAMLHDRTDFEDWLDVDRRRHLLRLWLSVPGDRRLPEVFATRFGSVEVGNRGGIVVPGTKFCVPLRSELTLRN
ncbi:MAG: TauD/TfdA family dioxygenase [Pirellulaceae bacterium]|nr:TauD/TfdA family dioxygenase [Pirellulaceae bacterium]